MPTDPPVNSFGGRFTPGNLVGGGRYELKRLLGQGGMGVVWLAHDQRLKEDVALKFLPPEISSDPIALDDMRREARKSHKLAHPNIIRIHDLCEAPDEPPFISMELVEGVTLSGLLAQQPQRVLNWQQLQSIFRQLCDALDYAHGENVIHRDLKPGNLMLDARGRLKLADFGIAAVVSDSVSRASVRHLASGTLTHMSPQQLDGELPRVTDDIYALGTTLYELITGRPPFHSGDIAHQIRNLAPKALEYRLWELEIENPVPAEVAAGVMACLSKDPAQRPQSVRALAEATGLTPGTGANIERHVPTTDALSDEPGIATTGAKPGRWYLWLGFAVVVSIIAGFLLIPRHAKAPETSKAVPATNEVEMVEEPPETNTMEMLPFKTMAIARPPGSPGSLDETFQSGTGKTDQKIYSFRPLANGQLIVAGAFTSIQGIPRQRIARLNANGSVDTTFGNASLGAFCRAHGLVVQSDGKILAGGGVSSANGSTRDGLARFNSNGTLDTTFNPHFRSRGQVFSVAVQPDGKILVGGAFGSVNGQPYRAFVRLLPNGAIDPTFKIGSGISGKVHEIDVQPDGKILIAGSFKAINGESINNVARLNQTGSLDPSFNPGTVFLAGKSAQASDMIWAMTRQPDGKVLVGGHFITINGAPRARIARLNVNGSLDYTFDPGAGANGYVQSIFVQADGKILIGGGFTTYNSIPRNGIARINPDGKLDTTFDPGGGANADVHCVAQMPDGKVVLAGTFTSYNAVDRGCVARVYGVPSATSAK